MNINLNAELISGRWSVKLNIEHEGLSLTTFLSREQMEKLSVDLQDYLQMFEDFERKKLLLKSQDV